MEPNDQNLKSLSDLFEKVLSPINEVRKEAENILNSQSSIEGFPRLIITLIHRLESNPTPQNIAISQSLSVYFKNLIKKRWDPEDFEGSCPIHSTDRQFIKEKIVDLLLISPQKIQFQLAESIYYITLVDYIEEWEQLIPTFAKKIEELFPSISTTVIPSTQNVFDLVNINSLSPVNITLIKGIFLTVYNVLKDFSTQKASDELFIQIQFCEKYLAIIMKNLYTILLSVVQNFYLNNVNFTQIFSKKDIEYILEILFYITNIFISLNSHDIPQQFFDNIANWFEQFLIILNFDINMRETVFAKAFRSGQAINILNDNEDDDDDEDDSGYLEKVQSSIIKIINTFASKFDDDFEPYLNGFINKICDILRQIDDHPKFNSIAVRGLQFLSFTFTSAANAKYLNPDLLKELIENIAIRNIRHTKKDIELLEDSPIQYIHKDFDEVEGESKRFYSIELIKGLAKVFPDKVTILCKDLILNSFHQYAQTNNWKLKDAALQMFIPLAAKTSSPIFGVTEINNNFDIKQFLETYVFPEIISDNINSLPIIKCTCLKLITLFRNYLGKNDIINLFPTLVRLLSSNVVVIQTYASICIDNLIKTREIKSGQFGTSTFNGPLLIVKQDISPFLEPLLTNLFNIFESDSIVENEYCIKSIVTVLHLLNTDVKAMTPFILGKLINRIHLVSKSPLNPTYNHFLFEAIALLISASCGNGNGITVPFDQALPVIVSFEDSLFPIFEYILSNDIGEFIPYVFQLVTQLLSVRPEDSVIPEKFRVLIPPLLSPTLWEIKSNIPGLVSIFKAYLSKGAKDPFIQNHLLTLLNYFQKLVSLKSQHNYAFQLIQTIILFVPQEVLNPYVKNILETFIVKLQEFFNKNIKKNIFITSFFVTYFLLIKRYGSTQILSLLDTNITTFLLQELWPLNSTGFSFTEESFNVSCYFFSYKSAFVVVIDAIVDIINNGPYVNQGNISLLQLLIRTLGDINKSLNAQTINIQKELPSDLIQYDPTFSKLSHSSLAPLDIPLFDNLVKVTNATDPLFRYNINKEALVYYIVQVVEPIAKHFSTPFP